MNSGPSLLTKKSFGQRARGLCRCLPLFARLFRGSASPFGTWKTRKPQGKFLFFYLKKKIHSKKEECAGIDEIYETRKRKENKSKTKKPPRN